MTLLRQNSHQPPPSSHRSWIAVLHKPFPIEIQQVINLPSSAPLKRTSPPTPTTIIVITSTPSSSSSQHPVRVDGVLVPGLQLLAVNDEPILNYTLTDAREKLNHASFPLRLRVYAVHSTGSRWRSPLFSEPQAAVGFKLDLNHLGHVQLGGVDTHRGRFRSATGLSAGMILTNVNGQIVSCADKTHNNHDTNPKTTRWIRQRLFERLSPPLFAPPPYVVALDTSTEFQTALRDEVTNSPIPESGLPSSLQSMTYKLERMATITTSNTTSRLARRIKSMPPRIPSTISETTINEDDPYPCLEKAMETTTATTTTTTTTTTNEAKTVRRSHSICAQPQVFQQPSSIGTTSTTRTTISTKKNNSLSLSAVRRNSTPKRPLNKMDRLKKPTFTKADSRLIDPTLDDDESTVSKDLVTIDRLDSNHSNTSNDHNPLVDSLPMSDEHDGIFEDIDVDEIRHVDASFTDNVPSFSRHRDSVIVRIHGSHRSLQSGDLIHPGLSGRSLLMEDANEGRVRGGENDQAFSWVEEDLNPESTHQDLTSTRDEPLPPAAVTVPALSPVGVQVLSTHRDGDILTIHLHKTSTNPRLGLILRQDFDASKAAGSGITIHSILKGGLFGDASALKPGQIIQQIQDRPCPTSTSKTFDLLASLTGRFSIQVKIPS